MGLSASEARVLLLTSKSNSLELQAQKIEQERLVLSQQQEDISQAFTDATSNQIFVTSSNEKEKNGKSLNMTTMAEASDGAYIVTSSTGRALYMVISETVPVEGSEKSTKADSSSGSGTTNSTSGSSSGANDSTSGSGEKSSDSASGSGSGTTNTTSGKNNDQLWKTVIKYYKWVSDGTPDGGSWVEKDPHEDRGLQSLAGDASINNQFQKGLQSGALQLYKVDRNDTRDVTDTQYNIASTGFEGYNNNNKIRSISLESSDFTTSKYYTEDDAAAQAAYQTAMTRINILDTRLENKLNALEKDKKAVDTEKESAQELVKKKTEGFKYFS